MWAVLYDDCRGLSFRCGGRQRPGWRASRAAAGPDRAAAFRHPHVSSCVGGVNGLGKDIAVLAYR